MDKGDILKIMGSIISGGAIVSLIKWYVETREKKAEKRIEKDKKLLVRVSLHWQLFDEIPDSIHIYTKNPKNYDVTIQSVKLMGERIDNGEHRILEIEIKGLENKILLLSRDKEEHHQHMSFPTLKTKLKCNVVFIRLIDHEDNYHDSNRINPEST